MPTKSKRPLLGKAGLARVHRDVAIATSVGGRSRRPCGMKPRGVMALERIAKEKPIVGVLANSIPLIDRVLLVALKPGAYVVRLHEVGEGTMAFDLFNEKSRPVLSTPAHATQAVSTGRQTPFYGLIDADLESVPPRTYLSWFDASTLTSWTSARWSPRRSWSPISAIAPWSCSIADTTC